MAHTKSLVEDKGALDMGRSYCALAQPPLKNNNNNNNPPQLIEHSRFLFQKALGPKPNIVSKRRF